MVIKYRIANSNRSKCTIPLPLLMGFLIGVISVYFYYLLLNCEDGRKFIRVFKNNQNKRLKSFSRLQEYHRVDLSKPIIHHNFSLLCLIFIDDIDSFLIQHNVWLDKCGNNHMYVSKFKHKYMDKIVTNTYSPQPWKYLCQTLIYLHTNYNSDNIKYDWIFLAKDNVWLIYENLIHLISLLNVDKREHNYYAGQYVDGALSINAGVLLSTNTFISLVHLLTNMDACNMDVFNNESQMFDFYLKKLYNSTPISNLDSFGCTLFHSINLNVMFDLKSLRPEMLKKCMSRFAITFQLDITSNYAIFYKYILYKIRLVTKQDLMPNANSILLTPSLEDEYIWQREALYELNIDSSNISQSDFRDIWFKKNPIIL